MDVNVYVCRWDGCTMSRDANEYPHTQLFFFFFLLRVFRRLIQNSTTGAVWKQPKLNGKWEPFIRLVLYACNAPWHSNVVTYLSAMCCACNLQRSSAIVYTAKCIHIDCWRAQSENDTIRLAIRKIVGSNRTPNTLDYGDICVLLHISTLQLFQVFVTTSKRSVFVWFYVRFSRMTNDEKSLYTIRHHIHV